MTLKQRLLDKYAERQPTAFVQIDGFAPDQCDDVITDQGGYGLTSSNTDELMTGCAPVRILVRPGTDPLLVSAILKAADGWYPSLCCNYDYSSRDATTRDIKNYVELMTPTERESLVAMLRNKNGDLGDLRF